MLPLRARVHPGARAITGYSTFPSITGTSLLDCLVSYPGHSFGDEFTPLQMCNQCILQPQLTGQYIELNVKTVLF